MQADRKHHSQEQRKQRAHRCRVRRTQQRTAETTTSWILKSKITARKSCNSEFSFVDHEKNSQEQRKQQIHGCRVLKTQPGTAETANSYVLDTKKHSQEQRKQRCHRTGRISWSPQFSRPAWRSPDVSGCLFGSLWISDDLEVSGGLQDFHLPDTARS